MSKNLEVVNEALSLVADIRINLCNAGLIQYGDGSDVYEASVKLSEALVAMYDKIKADEAKWNDGTREEWRTHGTVVVTKGQGMYALDPNFDEPGTHFVWLDGKTYFGSDRDSGGWVKIDA